MKKAVATTKWSASALEVTAQEEKGYVHPSSIIDSSVQLGEGAVIQANVVIERGTKIGPNVTIQTGCYIGEDCIIENDSVLQPFVTLREKTKIGQRVKIGSGVVVGSDGFGYAKEQNGINYKVPQVGYVVIEDDVVIGANTTIDRATLGTTVLGKGSKIGNLVQVGHNVTIGETSLIDNGVGICGSCKIGTAVTIGQGVGLVGHIRIGNQSTIQSGAGVSKDIADHSVNTGSPSMNIEEYKRFQSYIDQLPEFIEKIRKMESMLDIDTKNH